MNAEHTRDAQSTHFFFDAVDPLSFVMHRTLRALEEQRGALATRTPIESYPSDAPLTDTRDPFWQPRWSEGRRRAQAMGISLRRPDLVPRSRKSHELFLHAHGVALGASAIDAIFDAYFLEGRDIGRIDVLVEIASSLGLDLTESKAVLDVGRYEPEAQRARERAAEAGVTRAPALVTPRGALRGFHDEAAVTALLGER